MRTLTLTKANPNLNPIPKPNQTTCSLIKYEVEALLI